MKFSIEKATLLSALQYISKAPPTRSTLPILSCIFFEVKGSLLTMRTTNLEVFITMAAEVEGPEEGNIAIPLTTLLEILREVGEWKGR